MPRYYGSGSYSIGRNWRKSGLGKTAASAGRALIRAGVNKVVGGQGMYTGHGMYTGRGLYKKKRLVTNSLLKGGGHLREVPKFHADDDESGTVTLTRREFVTDVFGPAHINGTDGAVFPFVVQSYSINPGLESLFTWASQIASNYESYELKQCILTYRSTTTDIGSSTTGQCGTVIMATNYNPAAGPFTDKVAMMEYDAAMSCKTTESMSHGVECDPKKLAGTRQRYVRSSAISGQDLKSYDHGLFQLAVANSPESFANQQIGELWISYTVTLRTPKFYTGRGKAISQDIFAASSNMPGTSLTAINLFGSTSGSSILTGRQNSINCRLRLANGVIGITFPAAWAGDVEVKLLVEKTSGSAATTGNWSIPGDQGNVVGINDLYGSFDSAGTGPEDTFRIPLSGGGLDSHNLVMIRHVRVTPATGGVDNVCFINNGFGGHTIQQSFLTITEYNTVGSYKGQNIGPPGLQSDAIILTNTLGNVVQP